MGERRSEIREEVKENLIFLLRAGVSPPKKCLLVDCRAGSTSLYAHGAHSVCASGMSQVQRAIIDRQEKCEALKAWEERV